MRLAELVNPARGVAVRLLVLVVARGLRERRNVSTPDANERGSEERTVLTVKPRLSLLLGSTAIKALAPSFLTPPRRALPRKTSLLTVMRSGVSLMQSRRG